MTSPRDGATAPASDTGLAIAGARGNMARHQGPTCRLIVDLSGVDWGGDRDRATAKLLARPGVLAVEVDPDRRRAVVIDDAHHELPDLWNWLIEEAANREQDGGAP